MLTPSETVPRDALLSKDAPLAEFKNIAERYPVFHIVPAGTANQPS